MATKETTGLRWVGLARGATPADCPVCGIKANWPCRRVTRSGLGREMKNPHRERYGRPDAPDKSGIWEAGAAGFRAATPDARKDGAR